MATTAHLMTLQQQIRQEMADSLQRVHEEMHTAINGRLDAISSISSAMQRYQILHRTTTNEPLRTVRQVQGHRGFEAWHMIVRRYDQRNTSDRSSAYAAMISNISERDRAKDAEQIDDILRNFINETNKHEGRFGKIRDGEKTLAVKKLVPESLLNYRLRGTTFPYKELLIALENIIIDKVTTHSAPKMRKMKRAQQWRSAWLQEPMTRKHLKKGTEKRLNLMCKQRTRDQEAKVVGTEERVPVRANRCTSTAAKVKRSESCWKGTVVQDWETQTHRGELRQGELEQECERCTRRQR